jgi:ABC-type antimicrobial peptide transport system permease subunit
MVVGVVGTIRQEDLVDQRGTGAVYLPYSEYASRDVAVAIRTSLAPAAVASALRSAVLRVDPDLPVADVKPLQERIDDTLQQRRSPLLLAGLFSAMAVVLVTVGLYGVLAYAVSQRRREIGVRMALGAQPAQIRTQFLGLGARLALIGTGLGAIGAWWSGRAMNTLLFGVSPRQPAVFALTLVMLAAVALVACFLPAARAARVPPMEALRGD